MNELTLFNNPEFGTVRAIEIDGSAWLVGKEIAEKLGYVNATKAIQVHVDEEDKKKLDFKGFSHFVIGLWGENDFSDKVLINESGLYSLVMSSKMPDAKKFRRWVTSEVIPSIMRTGSYSIKKETAPELPNMSVMEMIAHIANNAVETEKRLTAIEATQEEHTQQIQDTNSKLANIHTVFADNLSDTFEDDVKKKVNAICQATGKSHVVVYAELYHAANAKAGCDIKRRQQNIISRKMKQGYSKTAATNSTSQLTVIAADKTLKNVCQMVLKQLCAEYLEF